MYVLVTLNLTLHCHRCGFGRFSCRKWERI